MHVSKIPITVFLSSSKRIQGTEGDCYVEIGHGILDSTKTYLCKLKYFQCATPAGWPAVSTMMMEIRGIQYFKTFSLLDKTPFCIIDTSSWAVSSSSPLMYEPANHLKVVRVPQNIVNIRLWKMDASPSVAIDPWTSGVDATLVSDWVIELQFLEIDPQE